MRINNGTSRVVGKSSFPLHTKKSRDMVPCSDCHSRSEGLRKGKIPANGRLCSSGDAGMVMMIEPVYKLLEDLKKNVPTMRYFTQVRTENLSPRKKQIDCPACKISLSLRHYKGIDQRIRDHLITKEISIGDYVLSWRRLARPLLRCRGTFARSPDR